MPDPKAKIRIEAEAALGAGIRQALGQINGFSNQAKSLLRGAFAGLSVVGIASFVQKQLELGDSLNKAAIKSGIATKAFTELAYSARAAGVDNESLSTALKTMQLALSRAASGGKEQKETLDALGLTFRQLKELAPDQQFELIAERISQLKDPADRTRAAVELFGRAGADLLPLFEQGAEGIRKAREEAEKLGQSFSKEQLQKLTDAKDSIDRMEESFSALATTLVSKVAPGLTAFFNEFNGVVTEADRLERILNYNKELAKIDRRNPAEREILLARIQQQEAQLSVLRRKEGLGSLATGHGPIKSFGGGVAGGFTDTAAAAKAAMAREEAELDAFMRQFDRLGGMVEFPEPDMENIRDTIEENTEDIADRMEEIFKEPFDQFSVYADQAARNMQDAFAQFLFDPFEDGIKGMLRGFIDVIRRMVAEAAAAKIFSSKGSGGLGLGDLLSAGFGALFGGSGTAGTGNYSGPRASGGPVSAGRAYLVGEKGPEMFLPGRSGTIIPNGGGVQITNNIDARGATSEAISALPEILKRNNQQLESQIIDGLRRRKYAL